MGPRQVRTRLDEPVTTRDQRPTLGNGPSTHLEAIVDRVNWISIPELTEPIRVQAKVRHRHEPAPATLTPLEDGLVKIEFDEPQRAVTPGQAAVFYQGDEVVGGGWIS